MNMIKACSSSLFRSIDEIANFSAVLGNRLFGRRLRSIYVAVDRLFYMTRVVHLARHGTHEEVGRVLSGRSEIGLSEAGQIEVSQLADRLDRASLHAIYSSPRRRALETAAAVAAHNSTSVQVRDELDEINFGEWTGQSFERLDREARWHDWNMRRGAGRPPGGETMAEAVARARSFIERIAEPEVLCVSHCDVIRGIVAFYLGLDFDRLLAFDCDPASLTTLVIGPEGGRLVTLNERPR
jgi:broad specificity phosphatase PhoE